MADDKYWRCPLCKAAWTGHYCHSCERGDAGDEMEPVEVWPEGTVARLRKALSDVVEAWETVDGCPGQTVVEIARAALAETEVKP